MQNMGKGKMYVNVVHRVDGDESSFHALQFQQDEAHKYGLRTTMAVRHDAMRVLEIIDYVKEQSNKYGDEICLSLHNLDGFELDGTVTQEPAIYLYSFEMKKRIINGLMETFHEAFGFFPASVAAYVLDAQTLEWIKSEYLTVQAAITNCFEEGVHMYAGNRNSWYLFCDGGPWGAYYPSRVNSLCPALDEKDAIGIVGLPHLNRDMILSLTSRDDLFSSHPANVMRGRAHDGNECTYMFRFIDQWIEQAKYNGFSYYNIFVSSFWLLPGKCFEDSHELSMKLYTESMAYLGYKQAEGLAEAMTMSEFAAWYKENIPVGTPEVNLWKDILCGSKRQMYWYIDPYMRATVDANIGGAICDLRPYAGRLERNLGPDTPHLANGIYPFSISCEHRGGTRLGSIHSAAVTYNGVTVDLYTKRTACRLKGEEGSGYAAVLAPVELDVGGLKVVIESVFHFEGEGKIRIVRRIKELSDPNAEVKLTEYHCGCWGTNTYPEDMRGITLHVKGHDSKQESIHYEYKGRKVEKENPVCITAVIPELNCEISLLPCGNANNGSFKEGILFSPYYTLALEKSLRKGEEVESCLMIKRLAES